MTIFCEKNFIFIKNKCAITKKAQTTQKLTNKVKYIKVNCD